ncbi:ADP-ribosylglycohydrolase family protein [Desulfobulbus alkaliphilus]|uniref:ADP-ribosylglycohydrolase family protein n=1 Tax=Desulfobulbus alkaliphilus TaxID=869814 RepID=UPI0019665CB0|nr:ADP-ribosylglycohydrolase family protein [Desulfobulbus alkaliphilus]MBM9536702.1 ADP-ribosylglycohydrolase family protein [Desulfobulbus alkaliphilus]
MTTHATAMVQASFVADSLALGAHWVYDIAEIDRRIGRVDDLRAPLPDSFHATKGRGDFTHYGDQALVLLESIAATGRFSLDGFSRSWRSLFDGYQGYIDKATATTLENMDKSPPPQPTGSSSSDLGGAARIAPLVFLYRNNLEQLLEAVHLQTSMSHNNVATLAGAEFLARTTFEVLQGVDPRVAMENALDAGVADIDLDNRIRGGLDSGGKDTRKVIGHFGQMCGIAAALPGAIHLIVTYPDDLKTALIENVMSGGDSAARGLAAGMVLGAHLGPDALPEQWLDGLNQKTHISALLASLENGA